MGRGGGKVRILIVFHCRLKDEIDSTSMLSFECVSLHEWQLPFNTIGSDRKGGTR